MERGGDTEREREGEGGRETEPERLQICGSRWKDQSYACLTRVKTFHAHMSLRTLTIGKYAKP